MQYGIIAGARQVRRVAACVVVGVVSLIAVEISFVSPPANPAVAVTFVAGAVAFSTVGGTVIVGVEYMQDLAIAVAVAAVVFFGLVLSGSPSGMSAFLAALALATAAAGSIVNHLLDRRLRQPDIKGKGMVG